MTSPRDNPFHCTYRLRWFLLSSTLICNAVGCWREVEYTPPATTENAEEHAPALADHATDTTEPTTPVASTEPEATGESKSAAGEFGEDLAKSLSAGEPKPTPSEPAEPADTTPISDSTPPPASVVGDRYAAKTAEPAPPSERARSTDSAPAGGESAPATDNFEALFAEPVDPNTPPNSPVNDSMPIEQREAIAEDSDKPIPNLEDDDFKNPPALQNWSTRRAAWLLGSKLSLAALANERGAPVADVEKLFSQSRALSKKLGFALKDLPARPVPGAAPATADPALNYLFTEGRQIGGDLARQGEDHAALFEVAVKSNILLVIYKPGAATTQAIASAIEKAGERAKLPATLWQPLLDTLAAKGSLADVRKSVYQLHDATDKYLDEAVPQ